MQRAGKAAFLRLMLFLSRTLKHQAEEEATAQRAGEDFSTRIDAYIRRKGMQTRQELIDCVNVRVPRN